MASRTAAVMQASAVQSFLGGATLGQDVRHSGRFDRLIDGLNRLPRPFLAFGALALFGFSMVDPLAFAARMQALQQIPDPLWWLLGVVVGCHFGAREAFHIRSKSTAKRLSESSGSGAA